MPSEADTGAARLADILTEAAGAPGPTSVELAELLWLATHIPPPARPPTSTTRTPGTTSGSDSPHSRSPNHPIPGNAGNRATNHNEPAPDTPTHPRPLPAPYSHPGSRIPLRLPARGAPATPGPDEVGPYTSLLAPAPPMLPRPLTLQRSLRPLKRSVPAPFGQELDEQATAHRIARLGATPQWWLPVLRPVTERWLTLHLVHDTGPTMPVWRPLVRELHTALAQSGVFRTVELHRLGTDGTVRRAGSQEAYADGRTVTLLISDCMGPQWRDGPAGARWYATLRRWSTRMPLAVVQPLPERLWRTTALPATTARIAAPGPAAPNSAYDVDAYALEDIPPDVLPVPVLEASAPWLANWSALVAGRARLPGAVGLLGTAPPPAPVDEQGRGDIERLSPEELLLRFRSLASPEAFRLAGHLAVGPPELPVMRLVHAAIERSPQPQHLAEVILSGALTAVPGTAGSYAFRPGVRELLLRTLPRSAHGRTAELLSRMGALIDARAGVTAGDFRVAVPGPGATTADGEPFAAVRKESVRRLGGAPKRAADANGPTIVMEWTDPDLHRATAGTLSHTLTWLLSMSGVAADQYELDAVQNGYRVSVTSDTSALTALNTALRALPSMLLETPEPPGVRLTFWHTAASPTNLPSPPEQPGTTIYLSPVLYERLTTSDVPVDRSRFHPLRQESADETPFVWYCPLDFPECAPDLHPQQRDLVRGPFTTRTPASIPLPEPGRTAIVVMPADSAPAVLDDPGRLPGTYLPGSLVTYYEVDLTTHRTGHELSLPASGRGSAGPGSFAASVELSWHVEDPVAFVRAEPANVSEQLLDHFIKEAGRITRRHPLARAGAAQHALRDALRRWPVPGLSVACATSLSAEGEEQSAPRPTLSRTRTRITPPAPSATALLDTQNVLIGFDGPLVGLYTRAKEEQATQELAALLAELRDPAAALSGEPLTHGGEPTPPLEGRPNPLDLLRAFAEHPRGADLRRRLNRIEERAVATAVTTPFSDSLITTLNALGRRVAVVADNAPSAVWRYLQAHGRLTGLVTGGVHGRAEDLTRLMPDPDCLLRALDHLGASPSDAVLVGSSVAELTAAKSIGLRFLGYTRSDRHRQRLAHAGCELTTASWAPLLQALPNT